jgi:uncharacterized protein (TIGR03435 family)
MYLKSCLLFALGVASVAALVLRAQTEPTLSVAGQHDKSGEPDDLSAFEVATVKPVDPNPKVIHSMGVNVRPGGRVEINDFPLKTLIGVAFHVGYWQISGGDDWIGKVEYDVVADPPESYRATMPNPRHSLFAIEDEHLCQMLQTLLIDRFQLKIHKETKTGRVYLLERNGKALALRPTEAGPAFSSIGWAEHWDISNTAMPQLAKFASDFVLHGPVVDRTGLGGYFDYRSPPEEPEVYQKDQNGSFLSMLRDVGLKLSLSKGPVETLVIDHAEKPSPN